MRFPMKRVLMIMLRQNGVYNYITICTSDDVYILWWIEDEMNALKNINRNSNSTYNFDC